MSINQQVTTTGALLRHRRSLFVALSLWFHRLFQTSGHALLIVLLAGVGFLARFYWMPLFPFREDEAIYAYWALHARHEDPWFLQVWPDKPPLFYGLLALLFGWMGDGEASVRGLNLVASTATIAVVALTARRLWSRFASLIATITLALHPLAISFAPTGFVDPLLTLLGTLALYAASGGAGFWAGLSLGAALMTKQQGLFYAPLVLLLLMIGAPRAQHPGTRRWLPVLVRFVAGTLVVAGPVIYWDSLRWAVAPSPWDQAVRNYAALVLLPPNQWPARLAHWQTYIRYVGGGWAGWGWLVTVAGVALWRWLRLQAHGARQEVPVKLLWPRGQSSEKRPVLWLLIAWSLLFLWLHISTSLQIWDRYLLPLAPMFALMAAGIAQATFRNGRAQREPRLASADPLWQRGWQALLVGTLALCLLPPALASARGTLPLGGDHGEYTGLDQILAYVRAESRPQAGGETVSETVAETVADTPSLILYHRALGWHYRYYLYDELRMGHIELRWFPHTVYLADNVTKTPRPRKLVVVPAWAPLSDLPLQLSTQRLVATELLQAGNFVLFEVSTVARPACDWCLCLPSLPHGFTFAGSRLVMDEPGAREQEPLLMSPAGTP